MSPPQGKSLAGVLLSIYCTEYCSNKLMKNITMEIADKYNVPIAKVDKTMRAALNYVQDQGKLNHLNAILKIDYIQPNMTISTKEFLALISEYINNDYFRNEILKKTLKNLNNRK